MNGRQVAQDGQVIYTSPLTKKRIDNRVDVLIGIPSWQGGVDPDMQTCLEHLIVHNNQIGLNIKLFKASSSIIAENRNACIDAGIECNARYVFMVDTDMIFPPDILTAMKVHNKAIVSAMAFMKTWPFTPNFYRRLSDTKWCPVMDIPEADDIFQVDCIGGACMLIELAAIKNIPRPWFAQPTQWHVPLMKQIKRLWEEADVDPLEVVEKVRMIHKRFAWDKTECGITGEDFYFSEMLREAGIPIWVDKSIRIGHKGKYMYKHEDFVHQLEVAKLDDFNKGISDMEEAITKLDKEYGYDNPKSDS